MIFAEPRPLKFLQAQPHPFQRFPQALRGILQPFGEILTGDSHLGKSGVVGGAVFPVVFIHREKIVGVESTPVKVPESERPTRAPVATCCKVSGLPSMAVEAWPLRVRVSFCKAGIQGKATLAPGGGRCLGVEEGGAADASQRRRYAEGGGRACDPVFAGGYARACGMVTPRLGGGLETRSP